MIDNKTIASSPLITRARLTEGRCGNSVELLLTPDLREAIGALTGLGLVRVDLNYRCDIDGCSSCRTSYRSDSGGSPRTRAQIKPAIQRLEHLLDEALAQVVEEQGLDIEFHVGMKFALDSQTQQWSVSGTASVYEAVVDLLAMEVVLR